MKILLNRAMIMMALSLLPMGLAHADVVSKYENTCATCHEPNNDFNAPAKGDTARWNQLKIQKGTDGLVRSVAQGTSQMPAMGLCQSCSHDDFAKLIDYMSQ
ncbi:c-type cytochrome [Moraxella nasovis]|uniref:c-type cytochrome n=1 Tax=Moraxella nasovis TaxID=2904121 RepID=UPI001F61DADB|nr:c-type cytochrome [Moraxella nasovis]UNU73687.1 c-type cytochrome [Moraxella nasovis]